MFIQLSEQQIRQGYKNNNETVLHSFSDDFCVPSAVFIFASLFNKGQLLTLLHSERPKLYTILAFLSAKGLKEEFAMLFMIRCPFGKVSSLPFGMILLVREASRKSQES